jgi:hypothetical protein
VGLWQGERILLPFTPLIMSTITNSNGSDNALSANSRRSIYGQKLNQPSFRERYCRRNKSTSVHGQEDELAFRSQLVKLLLLTWVSRYATDNGLGSGGHSTTTCTLSPRLQPDSWKLRGCLQRAPTCPSISPAKTTIYLIGTGRISIPDKINFSPWWLGKLTGKI